MAIIIDENTRVVVQGLTGREGRFHALRNRDYGTKVVAGVTPGKGGTDVEGIPVFDTMVEAVNETGANASIIFVPARFTADAVYEAADSGVGVIVCITEGVPAHDEARFVNYVHRAYPGTVLIGPNCPGLISPGKCNIGIMPGEITLAATDSTVGPVGLVSRSGTLTYQAVHELTQRGIGQTTCVGIGGDPVPGTGFIDCLSRFEADPDTKACVMIGEIGGSDEETAAAFIASEMTKPVVAYVAGVTAPPGKKMGHAGAIVSGSKGTAAAKIEALEKAGCRVGRNPSEIGELMAEVLKGA
jgi:succinyl-CoA synthetase alpha subunit